MKSVSIVIPCRNEERYISKCLESFISQTYPSDLYEVLVCDGRSDDDTRNIVYKYIKKYKNIKLIDNIGRTAPKAMNVGIKESKADIVIIFSAHAFAQHDFVENNVKALEDDKVGCVGGPIKTINQNLKGKAISLAMSSPFGVGNALFRYAKEKRYVDTVAFGAYKRKVLDKIGYFDEEFVRNQDDEINLRLTKAGYKILLSPNINSCYYGRSSFKKLWKQYFQYGFWKVKVLQKHGRTSSIRHFIPMIFVIFNILGILLGIFIKPIFYFWVFVVMLYLICDLVFSIKIIKNNLKLFIDTFVSFPILHFSYGIGFIEGIFEFYLFKSKRLMYNNTKMSR